MAKKLSAQPVRAVILRSAIGALGEDDELHTSLEMQGLTAAWMPGDHALSLIIGGGQVAGAQLEPALTVVVPPTPAWKLAMSFAFPPPPPPEIRKPRFGMVLGFGPPARRPKEPRFWGESAEVKTYRLESAPTAFPERPYVVEISSDRHRFRIFLTLEEADDLVVVLMYKPSWPKA
jgi:hypothetical protein